MLVLAVEEYACCYRSPGRWRIVRTLISEGCNVNATKCTEEGSDDVLELSEQCTPVMIACDYGCTALVKVLILAGADVASLLDDKGHYARRTLNFDPKSMDSIENVILCSVTEVKSLKHLSRLCVRATLTKNRFSKVSSLSGVLPSGLMHYLMLPEIDDIEEEFKMPKVKLKKHVCNCFCYW